MRIMRNNELDAEVQAMHHKIIMILIINNVDVQ